MASVTLDKVSKTYRERETTTSAVDALSLSIADGELLVIVGPSGCGKSTTLRLVAGLEAPSAGEIRFADRLMNGVAPHGRDVALVFQNSSLYPTMHVAANIGFGLRVRGEGKAEIERKVRDTARRLNIGHLLERRPGSLSGGEQRRVALARAIVRRPNVFLFDEPLSNLDASLRMQTRSELKGLHRDLGITTIHVTHDQEEAMTLGDRIAVMKEGRLQQCAPPMEVYDRPANLFVAGFIGSPPMNFIRGRLRSEGGESFFDCALGRVRIPVSRRADAARGMTSAEGGERILGLRPEHIHVNGRGDGGGGADKVGIPALVRTVEPLGDRMNVHLKCGSDVDVVARTACAEALAPGQSVTIHPAMDRAHFFDGA